MANPAQSNPPGFFAMLRVSIGPAHVLIGLVVLVAIAGVVATRQRAPGTTEVHRVRRDLPAYTRVEAGDTALVHVRRPSANAVPGDERVAGRLTTVALKEGDVVVQGSTVLVPSAYQLVALAITPAPAAHPGDPVTVVGVRTEDGGGTTVVERGIVISSASDQIVIAVPEADVEKLAPYLLGDNRLLIVRR
jgi:hypothetical protein